MAKLNVNIRSVTQYETYYALLLEQVELDWLRDIVIRASDTPHQAFRQEVLRELEARIAVFTS